MRLAIYIAKPGLRQNRQWTSSYKELSASHILYYVTSREDVEPDTDMLLSVGGDGTYLSAAQISAACGIPILGVNFGRLGFLSENAPDSIAAPLLSKEFVIEDRDLLQVSVNGGEPRYAFNEVTVSRRGAVLIGVSVSLDGQSLPTYWADGLLVATSSGSTAYSLSVGGPICLPESKVLIISPIAPHNLNMRPLIVPSGTKIGMDFHSREQGLILTADNSTEVIDDKAHIDISVAQFSLKRVRLGKSNFIGALRSKLFWGEDVRNEN